WLGAVDGLAPVGGGVAVTGHLPWQAWALGAAVGTWVAGFDLFYSLFDICTVLLLALAGLGLPVGWWYWLGVVCVGFLLGYEHSLVRPGDLRKLDAAFFTTNGVISVAFFFFVLFDSL